MINRLPSTVLLNKSPFELLFVSSPNYKNFKSFGYRVYPFLRDYDEHKLAPRSHPCIFLRYSSLHKGFHCLDPDSSRASPSSPTSDLDVSNFLDGTVIPPTALPPVVCLLSSMVNSLVPTCPVLYWMRPSSSPYSRLSLPLIRLLHPTHSACNRPADVCSCLASALCTGFGAYTAPAFLGPCSHAYPSYGYACSS